jgi:sugar phosphate isomerase/epimerase
VIDNQAPGRQLTLSFFSMRFASLDERVAAAAAAGFDGIGLFAGAYSRAAGAGMSDEEMLDVLGGMPVTELEALPFFRDDLLDVFAHLVSTFGAQRVQVIPPFVGDVDRVAAAKWLSDVADRLAPARLAIEFLPPTDVPDAAAAIEIAERADHAGIGLCVDSWHVFRGAGIGSLADLDAGKIVGVQINDGPLQPVLGDYIEDCLHHRCVPGTGEFDLRRFVDLLPPDVPIAVEVIDDDLDLQPPAVVAEQLITSVRALLAS